MSTAKVDTIKPVTSGADLSLQGDSGGAAVDCLNIDSSGDLNFSGNTNAKIKLPSAGGIYESDGTTAILTESGGEVTLANVAKGSNVTGFDTTLYVKAWCNFNGQGTPAIVADYNVATIGDNATGDYTITFESAISDANYAVTATCGFKTAGVTPIGVLGLNAEIATGNETAPSTTAFRLCMGNVSGDAVDYKYVSLIVTR